MLSSHCLAVSTVVCELLSVQFYFPLREFETYYHVSRQLLGLVVPVMEKKSHFTKLT